jgi:hypothetical protein
MHFFDDMVLDAGGEGFSGKTGDMRSRVIYLGAPCFVVDSHPDFRRGLGGEAVESQCGKKADYSSRHPLACFDEAVVLTTLLICTGRVVRVSMTSTHSSAMLSF